MARDYSKQGSKAGSTGKSKRAQPGKRRNTPKKNTRKSSRTPGWVWMGSGLFIGLTVAAVAYIATRPAGHPGRDFSKIEVPQPKQVQTTPAQPKDTAKKKSDKPQFSFYEMLPDYKVVVPGEKPPPGNSTDSSDNDSSHASPAEQTQSPAPTANDTGQYIIQVGAFSTSEDANRLKARVALLGLHANVVRSESGSGTVIYRVRSDVIDSGNRLTEMLKRLHDHDIETLVLQHGG